MQLCLLSIIIIIIFAIKIIYSNPTDHDVKEFVAGNVWEKPLKKYMDIIDYDIFKNQRLEMNALVTFVATSLKIHVIYLIAESKGENPDYNSTVLNRIKELDNITIDMTFPATSQLQHANQLDLKEEQERLAD